MTFGIEHLALSISDGQRATILRIYGTFNLAGHRYLNQGVLSWIHL